MRFKRNGNAISWPTDDDSQPPQCVRAERLADKVLAQNRPEVSDCPLRVVLGVQPCSHAKTLPPIRVAFDECAREGLSP